MEFIRKTPEDDVNFQLGFCPDCDALTIEGGGDMTHEELMAHFGGGTFAVARAEGLEPQTAFGGDLASLRQTLTVLKV